MANNEISTRTVKSTALAIGIVLAGLTISAYFLGIDHLLGFSKVAMSVVFVVAFIKVWLVTQFFMDVRHAPRWFNLLVTGWVLVTAAVVIGLYIGR
jgi:heme/copper-type cytochrome/quinol oxidase subunit 4